MITINLHGGFMVTAGVSKFPLDSSSGLTAARAILDIVKLYPALRPFWVTEDGSLSEHVLVVLNGKEIYAHKNSLQSTLQTGDRLDFFSPLSGG